MDPAAFAAAAPFALDAFQLQAMEALHRGHSVLVCVPTGAGKTVVGEYAVARALADGGKAFYTTPLKALSNQKFGDFIERHGAVDVGILTGDNTINGDAPCVIMTTEVLRNMLYERSDALHDLRVVVMDEVHYLKDPYRGAVWEEILILLPPEVAIVALSATVSNASEFGAWLEEVRGPTDVIVEEKRPVPIEHHYLDHDGLHDMFIDGRPNGNLLRRSARDDAERARRRGRGRGMRHGPDRIEVFERIKEAGMLPAIYFLFSRAGCDDAVRMCRSANLSLTTPDERRHIRDFLELRTAKIPPEDHAVLRLDDWADALSHGIGQHHAGLIPPCKEALEELFEAGLVRLVFATETLALGVNMPARAVVLERFKRWNGQHHEIISSGDYMQLTGRAGRRGKDEVGFGVSVAQSDVPFGRIAQVASGRSFPLTSSFRPSYNMTVSMLRHHTVEEATRLLDLSFAQFLADRSVVGDRGKIERNTAALAGYRERIRCECGDVLEYAALRRAATGEEAHDARSKRDRTRTAFAELRVGDVVVLPKGGQKVVVLDLRRGKPGEKHLLALTANRGTVRMSVGDFRGAPEVVGRVPVPDGNVNSRRVRAQVSDALRSFSFGGRGKRGAKGGAASEAEHDARVALRTHPTHSCPDREDHLRWVTRVEALEAETERLRRRIHGRAGTLATDFHRVLEVLEALGYVEDGKNTDRGERLARIFSEVDLLVSEAVGDGTLDGLTPEELAATVSAFVYQSRPADEVTGPPPAAVRRALLRISSTFRDVRSQETDHRISLVREPDSGFALPVFRWASGDDLEDVLELAGCTPGDFVRNVKQTWDLLRQIAEVSDDPLSGTARNAARSIYRGVVAYAGTL